MENTSRRDTDIVQLKSPAPTVILPRLLEQMICATLAGPLLAQTRLTRDFSAFRTSCHNPWSWSSLKYRHHRLRTLVQLPDAIFAVLHLTHSRDAIQHFLTTRHIIFLVVLHHIVLLAIVEISVSTTSVSSFVHRRTFILHSATADGCIWRGGRCTKVVWCRSLHSRTFVFHGPTGGGCIWRG